MSSLATRILKGEIVRFPPEALSYEEKAADRMRGFILNAVKIHIQNVADYMMSWPKAEGFSYRGDLPNCAPPFERMWFEYRFLDRTFGVAIHGIDNGPGRTYPWTLRWYVVATDGRDITAIAQSEWNVEPDGHLSLDAEREVLIEPKWAERYYREGDDENQQAQMFVTLVLPPLMAISFMHCRNVEMIPMNILKIGPRPRRLRERPTVEWKILKIRAMTKFLDSSGKRGDSLATRLHICRGHFKDYTKSGLFGRHKGVYWWHSQLRGDEHEGVVHKEYEVDAR